ncbi:hypothetical protein [Coleofasciculus chthonoplastes]|jgi:hypothetical protein|uniref:hypothetical protein n=1 Tax=Coleofasciculus chthonoplastes TaxID=64178 RepID=UPI0032F9A52C
MARLEAGGEEKTGELPASIIGDIAVGIRFKSNIRMIIIIIYYYNCLSVSGA